ncbi:MAG TPA: D-ribose pyranase [Vibrio sp.]|uniref:D-ribose pyranase n=1 Tax=Vibrio TaxID=662 RepID=UPI0004067C2B|nr:MULTISPECIES: D-ribose pyranase [Vibrio]HCH01360.1 D-ribose pyranase [Vibrio sp.]
MKKSALLHSEFSHLIATLGHTDEITICDAGLPIPHTTPRIDLALTLGIPTFAQTVDVFLKESQIEGVILAEEFKQFSPEHHNALLQRIEQEEKLTGKEINITYITHEAFKSRSHQSKAIIRTGECTPYANVIFQSGVTF